MRYGPHQRGHSHGSLDDTEVPEAVHQRDSPTGEPQGSAELVTLYGKAAHSEYAQGNDSQVDAQLQVLCCEAAQGRCQALNSRSGIWN